MTDLANAPDKELRKAWLKRKFGSYEYHEELLRLHAEWYALIRRGVERPEVRRDYPEQYRFFTEVAFPQFDRAWKPGVCKPEQWMANRVGGSYRGIDEYDHDTGLETDWAWEWMPADEKAAMYSLWGKMSKICLNIRQTVDGLWFNPRKGNDDSILNDKYTDPIDWPPNWQQDVADVTPQTADERPQSVAAGKPCPRSGWWFTPAGQHGARRYFKQGDAFPAIEDSSFGATFWQWPPDQSEPKL